MGVVVVVWGVAAVRWSAPALVVLRRLLQDLARRGGASGPARKRREREETPAVVQDGGARLGLRIGVGMAAAVPLVLAVVAVLFLGLPQGRVAIFSGTNDQARDQRLSLWQLGLEMTADRPLLGHGQDGFSIQFPSYRDRPDLAGIGTLPFAPESSHNFFLDLATGTGLLGLIAFLALVGAVLWHAGRRALATDDAPLRIGLVSLGAGVLGYLAAIFFGFSEAMTTWVLWLLLGAMAGLLARVPAETPKPASRKERRRKAAPPPESGTLASGLAAVGLSLLGTIVLVWAATITAADLAAGQADAASRRGEFAAAARLADRATTWNPIRKDYLAQAAAAYQRAARGATDQAEVLRKAVDSYDTLVRNYQPTALDLLKRAGAKIELALAEGTPLEDILPEIEGDLERAAELDPFNRAAREEVVSFYRNLGLDDRARQHQTVIFCWTVWECD
jgi:hypothetical protein